MNRSRRTNRSRLGAGIRKLFGGGRSAGALADAAGAAAPFEGIEALEERQLLFTLTVDPASVDPQTGVGTVSGTFGYAVPFFDAVVMPQAGMSMDITEDFNMNFPAAPPANIQNGLEWTQSHLWVGHNLTSLLLVGNMMMNNLQATMQAGQHLDFSFLNGGNGGLVPIPDPPAGPGRLGVQTVTMEIGQNLDAGDTTVQLMLGGVVVASFTGNQLLAQGMPLGGGVSRYTFTAPGNGFFDTVRFQASGGSPSHIFTIDNVTTTVNPSADIPEEIARLFGATFAFSGPAGASIQFLDVYGRDMILTTKVGVPPMGIVPAIDPNGNSIPDFNDGIGKIIIRNSNDRTAFTMFGGTIQGYDTFSLQSGLTGQFDTFESAGFGFFETRMGQQVVVTGLPSGPGAVIVGSPFVRPQGNYNPGGLAGFTGFSNPDQGVFVLGGNAIGSVYIDGLLYGTSQITSSIDRFVIGSMFGSANITGDLGSMVVAGDAGLLSNDPSAPSTAATSTLSQITVGRAAGSIDVGGRSLMNVTVVGDLGVPATRPPGDIYRYYEKEYAQLAFNPPEQVQPTILDVLNNNDGLARDKVFGPLSAIFGRFDQSIVFGNGYYRNDTIMSAEWLNTVATAVEVHGELGEGDGVNTAEDPSDVYGIAVDGTQDLLIDFGAGNTFAAIAGDVRLVDSHGRTVAAPELGKGLQRSIQFRYHPDSPGVYYLVVHADGVFGAPNTLGFTPYIITVSGMASTSLGTFRAAGSIGGGASPSITVLSGSVGSIRVGTGFVNGAGAETDPSVIFNPLAGFDEDASLGWYTSSVTVPGSLYNITAGADIGRSATGPNVLVTVGGNFGTLYTGLNMSVMTMGVAQGDLRSFGLTVGGSIAGFDIRGGLGADEGAPMDLTTFAPDLQDSIQVRTGRNPLLRGDVGVIRVGSRAGAATFMLQTPNNSVVTGIFVDQDNPDDGTISAMNLRGILLGRGAIGAQNGLDLRLGFNSDLRFFDTTRIDIQNVADQGFPLVDNATPLIFTDDSGAQFSVQIRGGDATMATGFVRVVPISGSLGVAVGRIDANLAGGAQLLITSLTNNPAQVVSIGDIVIRDSDAGSAVVMSGPGQIDVWKIEQLGGTAFGSIINGTPNGDIVAIDMQQVTTVMTGANGDIGRTQTPVGLPQHIGPYLGITSMTGGAIRGPIFLPPAAILPGWSGNTFRPITNAAANAAPFLDDIGSPIDPYLDGIIVRAGDIFQVQAGGAIGDVISDSATGNIGMVVANNDHTAPAGKFDGIIGNIYGNRIGSVDVGAGLMNRTQGPLATTGIVARDDIGTVIASQPDSFISSNVLAANLTIGNAGTTTLIGTTNFQFPVDGIGSIQMRGSGGFVDAFIGAMTLDDFWTSFFTGDGGIYLGDIGTVMGTPNGAGGAPNFFRSEMWAREINTVTLMGGFFDASIISASDNLQHLEAAGYRNSTLAGGDLEFHENRIFVGRDLVLMTTTGTTGDINDIGVDVLGHLRTISARNISRSTIDADISIDNLRATNSIRGSTITTGQLMSGTVGNFVATSDFEIGGDLAMLTVTHSMTDSIINVTGPDGRIDHVTIGDNFSGQISSAGPIDMFETTNGDLVATIHTVTNQHGVVGNINTIKAGRDLDLRGDVGGTIANMVAGRHIGNQFARTLLVVRGDVMKIDVANGQLYADLRIAGQVMNATIGAAFNTPSGSNLGLGSIVAAGHIDMVTINGDFGGQIISNSGGINVITINNGSLVPGGLLAAYAGDFNNLVINNGDLFGTVHADRNLLSIRLNGSGDGVFGHLGVNPNLSSGAAYDDHRNQLPPNVAATSAINGPVITAGLNIGRIILTSGSIFEAFIYAGRAIGTIDVTGDIRNDPLTAGIGTVVAAGSTINVVHATGVITNTAVLAGIVSFGDDNFPGGTGANADVVRSGRITAVMGDGGGANDVIAAGVTAGADGVYNTGDELLAPGISYARTVNFGGTASNVSVYSDGPTTSATPGVSVHTGVLANNDPDINDGAAVGTPITHGAALPFTWNGVSGTILFTGPGRAYWDAATGRVRLANTSLDSALTVNANGTLTNFGITTNNNASMGTITVNAPLAGASVIDVDAYCLAINVQSMADTTTIKAGANLRALNIGAFTGGSVVSSYWLRDLTIAGNFGTVDDSGEASINLLSGATINIGGQDAALINVDRDLSALNVAGPMTLAQFRVGSSVGAINAGALDRTRIAAGSSIGPVSVAGNVNETTIQAGGDLGADAAPGGTGFNADTVSAGTIGNVMIGGDFVRSNIVAGLLRGPDAYFGTTDDTVAPGISGIGTVTVAGVGVGSNVNTEQFRIEAPGSLGAVTFQGQAPQNNGNFLVKPLGLEVSPIQIIDLRPDVDSNTWVVNIQFNQSINVSTVGPALTVSEVRNGGQTLLPLVQGVDYTFGEYDAVHNILPVIFSRTITDRPLVPEGSQPMPGTSTNGAPDPNLPGPGVYRFDLRADTLRAAVADARLDGDGNGIVAPNENYSQDTFVGDAGDKFTGQVVNLGPPYQGAPDELINFYTPDDLDLVMDNNRNPDGLPDPNRDFTLRGFIGDHPNNDTATFESGGDTDIYKITLQAGQILRLGVMSGEAQFAGRFLMNAAGVVQGRTTADSVQLPVNPVDLTLIQGAGGFPPSEDAYLIKTTGVYYIVVSNDTAGNILDPTLVSNIAPAGGFVGHYNFTVQVFDDGNTGFAGPTNAGNGDNVVNAPDPIVFAGNDGVFGTSDDRSVVTIGAFKFFLDAGADGVRGTADDIVSGNNDAGITSTRQNGVLTTTINSAIGPAGHAGAPGFVTSDTDVYNLNNGQTIAPGTQITVRIKLADLGADLGSFNQDSFTNFAGDVQFGIFDVTDATGVNDGLLYLSPSDFKPLPGQASKQIAARGDSSYGFDANGDFYLTFVVPSHIGGTAGQAPKMSVYLQGVYNTDYTIEVSQLAATGQAFTVPQTSQNIFIETRGGTVDWLQAGGQITKLDPFTSSVLGFTGTVGGVPVDQYVLTHLISNLQSIFAANGLNVVFSTTPAAFEFQPYSTVFLTKTPDPISAFNADNFGYAQHADPNNLDKNDEAVVFTPSFAQLAFTPSQTDVDSFVLSLTAAVGRHIGELMGLRVSAQATGTPVDIMAANSPFFVPGSISDFEYPNMARQLSTPTDNIPQTNFFLGQQNAFALLDKFLTP